MPGHQTTKWTAVAVATASVEYKKLRADLPNRPDRLGGLENARQPGCIAFQSDQRVRVLATGRAAYPDASMVCGPIEGGPADASPIPR